MRWFLKEFLGNPCYFNGNRVEFEHIGDGNGIIGLDEARDAALIAYLDSLADMRAGGVCRISAETAERLKKKPSQGQPVPPRTLEALPPTTRALSASGRPPSQATGSPAPPVRPVDAGRADADRPDDQHELAVASLREITERLRSAKRREGDRALQ